MSEPVPPTDALPHPVVAASVAVFRGNEVLLVKRAKPPYLWALPGGRVELGETLRQTALRELMEETSITAEIVGQVQALEVLPEEAEGNHFVIVNFAARHGGGTVRAGSDAADAAWVGRADLAGYEMTANAQAIIARARALVAAAP